MFIRAQFSSQIASATDFLVTILLVKLFGIYYVYATFTGFCLRRDRELHHQLQMDIQIQRMQETACNGKIPAGLDRQYLTEYLGDLLHDGNDQQESLGPGNPETLYRRLVRLFQDSSLAACRISLEL